MGPGFGSGEVKHVTSAWVPLAGTKLDGVSAEELDIYSLIVIPKENHIGLGD